MGTQATIQLANLGMADSLILMVMALVVFGPRRLPQIGRQVGKLMYEFRKASNDFKFQMEEELRVTEDAERRKKEEERLSALASNGQAAADSPASPASETASPTPAESPYPNETLYPAVTAAAPEPPAEEPYPRILPPSTGEQVPAARPGKKSAQAKPPASKKSGGSAKGKLATGKKVPAKAKNISKSSGRRA